MDDKNPNNIPEEMSFDERALNNFQNQGVSGYQPGMYQQGQYNPQANGYQPGMYQQGQYQQGQYQPQPNAYQPGMYQNYMEPQRVPQAAPQRVPQAAPQRVPQRVPNQPPRQMNDANNYYQQMPPYQGYQNNPNNGAYDKKAQKKLDKKRAKEEQRLREKEEAAQRRRELKESKPVNFLLRMIGGILFLVQIILTIITAVLTIKSRMLPTKYLLVVLGAMVFMTILNFCLLKGGFPRKKFNAGFVITILTCVGLAAVIYYVYGGISALESITGIKVETTVYGVYVREDDPAEDFHDVRNYTFGTCFSMESNDEDDIVKKLNKEIGKDPDLMDFPDMISQIDALLDGTTGATVMTQSRLSTITDVAGYEDIEDRVREIGTFTVTRIVRTASDKNISSEDTFVVYISGNDQEGSKVTDSGRSDVNIIAVINPTTHQILLISTPRDYYVTLYGLPDGGSSSMKDKLTHAGNYGIDCSAETLGELYGVDIDYYFRCNFTGFREIIDALGGVTVYSDYNFSYGGYNFVQGENRDLGGDAALCFARERKSFADGDRQRGRNQMAVIEAVVHKMTSPAILKNYQDTMDGLEGSFATSMPYDLISDLVNDQLDDGGEWDVQKFSVTGTNANCTTYSTPRQSLYVMEPDMNTVNQAREYIDAMFDDEVIQVNQ